MKFKNNGLMVGIFVSIGILLFGFIIAYLLNYKSLSNIEGFLFRSSYGYDATDSNATSSNATGSNATCSNATSTNATSGNATSSNATSTNATSGNATCSNATSGNATSSNATSLNIDYKEVINKYYVDDNDNTYYYDNATSSNNENSNKNSENTNKNSENQIINEIETIGNLDNNSAIYVDASKNAIIDSSMFEGIKGTDKKLIITYNDNQRVFNGTDIVNVTTFDAKISVYNAETLSMSSDALSVLSNAIAISLPDAKTIPGKSLVRLKRTDLFNKLNISGLYLYYYNESNKSLELIATNVTLSSDGYYEFVIDHHSTYVLSNTYYSNSNDTVNFQKDDKTLYILIGLGGLLIISVAAILIIVIKNNKKISN